MVIQRQQGLTLVELLVGMALGLIIIAAALTLLVHRLKEHRSMLIESRLLQDLRVSADVVTRDLRRAGYWADAGAGVARQGSTARANPYTALAPAAAASDAVSFHYSRDGSENDGVDDNERFGFRLRQGVIEMSLGTGNWQALTDAASLVVTAFSITPALQQIDLQAACPMPCPPGSDECGPQQVVRSLALVISGRSATDSAVLRSVRSHVRLRNDVVSGACEE